MSELEKGNLFRRFGIQSPAPATAEGQYGSLLVRHNLIPARERATIGDIKTLWLFIRTFVPNVLEFLTTIRGRQRALLNNELNIDLNAALVQEIEDLLQREFNINAVLGAENPDPRTMAVLALKLALDYVKGNWPKVQITEEREAFLPIPLGSSPTEALGRTLMILNEAEAKGASIQDLLDLLTRMEADFWRLPAIQKIHNAKASLRMIEAGITIVAPGTDTRIAREGERAAVSLAIAAARRRIGDAVQDLEAKLAEMFTPAEGGEDQ